MHNVIDAFGYGCYRQCVRLIATSMEGTMPAKKKAATKKPAAKTTKKPAAKTTKKSTRKAAKKR